MARSQLIDWETVGKALDELTAISEEDDEHAIEMDSDLTQFLSALDSWREVANFGDLEAVAAVSEAIMNILDFYFVEDTPLEQWLSVPQLHEELSAQVNFLKGRCNNRLHTDLATAALFEEVSLFNLFRFSAAFSVRRPPCEAEL